MVEPGPRLSALQLWLDEHPRARVSAAGIDALPVPVPPEVILGPQHTVDTKSILDLVAPGSRPSLARAFVTARRTGQGVARAYLLDSTSAIEVHYLDLAPELPVLIRMFVEGEEIASPPATPPRRVAQSRLGIISKDEAGRIVAVDEGASYLLGWRAEDVIGQSTLDFIHPDDQERALENWWSMLDGGGSQVVRIRYHRADGSWLWLDTSNSYDTRERSVAAVSCQIIDASQEMAAADALRRSEQLLRRLAETVPVGLCVVDADRTVSYLNPRLADLLGTVDIADVADLDHLLTSDPIDAFAAATSAALGSGSDSEVEVTIGRDSQTTLRCRVTLSAVVDQDVVTGMLVCVVDVTELKRRATIDPLTGLLNRQAVTERLGEALRSHEFLTGVLFLDLDAFKPVNDVYGHLFGDRVLTAAAERLRVAVRSRDALGRLGGDEFLVVCPGLVRPADLENVAGRVREVVSVPFVLDGVSVQLGVSIGMTVTDDPQDSAQSVIAQADSAMYEAKRQSAGPIWAEPSR